MLSFILPGYTQIIAAPSKSHGGYVILVHLDLRISTSSTIGTGLVAWAQIHDVRGDFGIIGVYAPSRSAREQVALWYQMKLGNSILMGDFNMVLDLLGSCGSSLMNERELEE